MAMQHSAKQRVLVLPVRLQMCYFLCLTSPQPVSPVSSCSSPLLGSQAAVCVPDRGVSVQLASVQFHLINTAILFLSREGFRRGCLRSEQDGGAMHVPRLLATAALVLPVGAVTAAATCGLMLRRHGPAGPGDPYPTAVYMQGADQLPGGDRPEIRHLPPASAASCLPAHLPLWLSR